jgi:hypothetical protein
MNVDNVRILPFAVWAISGPVKMFNIGATSYIQGIAGSPANSNNAYQPSPADLIEVEAKWFRDIDDGTIDVLQLDMEGAEWYALLTMKSKPKIITIEMEYNKYKNPQESLF